MHLPPHQKYRRYRKQEWYVLMVLVSIVFWLIPPNSGLPEFIGLYCSLPNSTVDIFYCHLVDIWYTSVFSSRLVYSNIRFGNLSSESLYRIYLTKIWPCCWWRRRWNGYNYIYWVQHFYFPNIILILCVLKTDHHCQPTPMRNSSLLSEDCQNSNFGIYIITIIIMLHLSLKLTGQNILSQLRCSCQP